MGPLGLCTAVVLALSAILIVSMVDFFDSADEPSPEPVPPVLARVMHALGAANALGGGRSGGNL